MRRAYSIYLLSGAVVCAVLAVLALVTGQYLWIIVCVGGCVSCLWGFLSRRQLKGPFYRTTPRLLDGAKAKSIDLNELVLRLRRTTRRSQAVAWPQRLRSAAPIYACDGVTACTVPTLSGTQEEGEGGEEYAAYHPNREAERGASFGPEPVMVAVAADESQVGEAGEGSEGERQSGPAPGIKCGGGEGSESEFTVSSGAGRREYVANQCLAQKSYPRGRRWGHIKAIHDPGGHGNWRDVGDAYCGVVGAQALVPGLDIFDAPVEIACAGYGVFRATEILVGSL